MRAALRGRRTKPGCEQSLQEAIDKLPRGDKKNEEYIIKEWWNRIPEVSLIIILNHFVCSCRWWPQNYWLNLY
jgi:hypothetical protein